MFKVIRGAVHHKGKVYRKDDILPESFTNKQRYKHVVEIEDAIDAEFHEVKKPKKVK